jgi:hypothetical protein
MNDDITLSLCTPLTPLVNKSMLSSLQADGDKTGLEVAADCIRAIRTSETIR